MLVSICFGVKASALVQPSTVDISQRSGLTNTLFFQRLCDNMSQNLVEQLAARRRARGAALNSTLLAVVAKDETDEKKVVPKNSPPPSKKVST